MTELPRQIKLELTPLFGEAQAQKYSHILAELKRQVGQEAYELSLDYLHRNKGLDMALLSELNSRGERAVTPIQHNVAKGRKVVAEFFQQEDNKRLLMPIGGIPMYYGSLQYDDPINLDADILVISTNYGINRYNPYRMALIAAKNDQLMQLWKNKKLMNFNESNEPHISVCDIREVFNPSIDNQDASALFDLGSDISVILSAQPILAKDANQLDNIRQSIYKTDYEPILIAFINAELQSCLKIRQKRAKNYQS